MPERRKTEDRESFRIREANRFSKLSTCDGLGRRAYLSAILMQDAMKPLNYITTRHASFAGQTDISFS